MQVRRYRVLTFQFDGSWVWTVVEAGSVAVLQRGTGYKTMKAAYGAGAEWLRRYKHGQITVIQNESRG